MTLVATRVFVLPAVLHVQALFVFDVEEVLQRIRDHLIYNAAKVGELLVECLVVLGFGLAVEHVEKGLGLDCFGDGPAGSCLFVLLLLFHFLQLKIFSLFPLDLATLARYGIVFLDLKALCQHQVVHVLVLLEVEPHGKVVSPSLINNVNVVELLEEGLVERLDFHGGFNVVFEGSEPKLIESLSLNVLFVSFELILSEIIRHVFELFLVGTSLAFDELALFYGQGDILYQKLFFNNFLCSPLLFPEFDKLLVVEEDGVGPDLLAERELLDEALHLLESLW